MTLETHAGNLALVPGRRPARPDARPAAPASPGRVRSTADCRAPPEQQLAELVAESWNCGRRIISGVRGRGRSMGTSAMMRPGRGLITATTSARNTASDDRVGDQQGGGRPLGPDPLQLEVEALAGHLVERAERLVEQQDLGVDHQGPGDGHPLAHAARQLGRAGPWSKPSRPTSGIRSSISWSDFCRPLTSRGRRMLLVTDPPRQQGRVLEGDAELVVAPGQLAARSPWTSASPEVGVSRSARIRRMVDLPQPDGPSRATKAPAGAAKSTWSSAVTDLAPDPELLGQVVQRDALPVATRGRPCRPASGCQCRRTAVRVGQWPPRQAVGLGLEVGVLLVDLGQHRHVEQLVGGDGGAADRRGS